MTMFPSTTPVTAAFLHALCLVSYPGSSQFRELEPGYEARPFYDILSHCPVNTAEISIPDTDEEKAS